MNEDDAKAVLEFNFHGKKQRISREHAKELRDLLSKILGDSKCGGCGYCSYRWHYVPSYDPLYPITIYDGIGNDLSGAVQTITAYYVDQSKETH